MASTLHPDHPLYEVREVHGHEVGWMLRRNIWTGVMGSLAVTFLTNGVFFTAFCQHMGMQHYQFGILATLVFLTMPLALFSSAIEEWFGQRKYPWFIFAMLSRLCLVPFLFGFFVEFNPWIIVALVVTMMSMARLISPLWLSWTWDYIPSDSFGRFTARRNFWITFWRAAVAVGGAILIHMMPPESEIQVISAIFMLLVALGILDLLFHVQIPEPPRSAAPSRSIHKFLDAFTNAPFRNFLLAIALWHFALFIGAPFSVPYMMDDLGFGHNFLGATLLVYAVPAAGTLLTLPLWGKLADTKHAGIILTFCCVFWSFIPLFYFFSHQDNAIWMLGAAWVTAGIFPAGYAVVQPLLTRKLSGEDKTMPSALLLLVAASGGVAGSGIGTMIVHNYDVTTAFGVSFATRITAALLGGLLVTGSTLWKRKCGEEKVTE